MEQLLISERKVGQIGMKHEDFDNKYCNHCVRTTKHEIISHEESRCLQCGKLKKKVTRDSIRYQGGDKNWHSQERP